MMVAIVSAIMVLLFATVCVMSIILIAHDLDEEKKRKEREGKEDESAN